MDFAVNAHKRGCTPFSRCGMCRLADHFRSKLGTEALSDYRRYREQIGVLSGDLAQPVTTTSAPCKRVLDKYGIATVGNLIAYFEERESKLDDFDSSDFDRLTTVLYELLPREPARRPC